MATPVIDLKTVKTLTTAAGGAVRALGTTARAAVGDVVSGVTRAGEAVADKAKGRTRSEPVLRIRVLILSDERGVPLCTPEDVEPALRLADEVLSRGAGIRVRSLGIRTVTDPAPTAALDPGANRKLLLDDVMGRTSFYRRHLGVWETMGTPVTVVVVREIEGRTTGCSLGMTADWVICQASLFDKNSPNTYDETVLVHELAHALNLPHHRGRRNLLFPSSSPPDQLRGTGLTGWQKAVLQANRHVLPGAVDAGEIAGPVGP